SLAYEINAGRVTRRCLEPRDFGMPCAQPEDLKGGGLDVNHKIAIRVLSGEKGPQRDIVLVNASAALVAAGLAASFMDGIEAAARSIDTGRAQGKLEALARFTN